MLDPIMQFCPNCCGSSHHDVGHVSALLSNTAVQDMLLTCVQHMHTVSLSAPCTWFLTPTTPPVRNLTNFTLQRAPYDRAGYDVAFKRRKVASFRHLSAKSPQRLTRHQLHKGTLQAARMPAEAWKSRLLKPTQSKFFAATPKHMHLHHAFCQKRHHD